MVRKRYGLMIDEWKEPNIERGWLTRKKNEATLADRLIDVKQRIEKRVALQLLSF